MTDKGFTTVGCYAAAIVIAFGLMMLWLAPIVVSVAMLRSGK